MAIPRWHWICGTGGLRWSSGRIINFVIDSNQTIPDGYFIMVERLVQLLHILLPDIQKLEELKELAETETFQQDWHEEIENGFCLDQILYFPVKFSRFLQVESFHIQRLQSELNWWKYLSLDRLLVLGLGLSWHLRLCLRLCLPLVLGKVLLTWRWHDAVVEDRLVQTLTWLLLQSWAPCLDQFLAISHLAKTLAMRGEPNH